MNPFDQFDAPVEANFFDQFDEQPKKRKPVDRNAFAVANDTVIEAANAVAGGVGSVANFVSPGNSVSRFIDEKIVKPGEQSQSDVVQAEKQRLSEEIQSADGFLDEAKAAASYAARNPLLSAAQAAGSFALPGGAVKAGGAAAKALGAGAQAAQRVALGGGVAAGAALSGGDAAGTAYDLAKKGGATEEQAIEAARQASAIPAVIGGAGGLVGAERLVAGAKGFTGNVASRALKTGAVEAAQEGLEEGVTQYEGQRAAVPYNPGLDPMKGVGAAATTGAILGAATGGGVSALQGAAPTVQPAQAVAPEQVGPETGAPPSSERPQSNAPAMVEARLAELEIIASQRELAPAERAEAEQLIATLEESDVSNRDAPTELAQEGSQRTSGDPGSSVGVARPDAAIDGGSDSGATGMVSVDGATAPVRAGADEQVAAVANESPNVQDLQQTDAQFGEAGQSEASASGGADAGMAVESASVPAPGPSALEAAGVAGPPIDNEWTLFASQTGTLAIPRSEMPQIKAENRGALVSFLAARGIGSQSGLEVQASSLKPTQAEFSPAKVAQAKEFTGGNRSILVSSDGHVLDGHHQWLAALEQGDPVKAIRLDAPIADLLSAVRQFPSVQADTGASAPVEAISPESLAQSRPGAPSKDFARSVIGRMQEAGQDVEALITDQGELSSAGQQVVQQELQALAYGDGASVAALAAETLPELRAIGNALSAIAGDWAGMREAVRQGLVPAEVDVTGNLMEAVSMVREAAANQASLFDMVQQADPITAGLVRMMREGSYLTIPAKPGQTEARLRAYVEAANAAAGDSTQTVQLAPEEVAAAVVQGDFNGQTNATQDPGQSAVSVDTGRGATGPTAKVNDKPSDGAAGSGEGKPKKPAASAKRQQASPSSEAAQEGDEAAGVKSAFKRSPKQTGMSVTEVEDLARSISAGWGNAPEIIVVRDLQDPKVPADIRAEDERQRRQAALLSGFDGGERSAVSLQKQLQIAVMDSKLSGSLSSSKSALDEVNRLLEVPGQPFVWRPASNLVDTRSAPIKGRIDGSLSHIETLRDFLNRQAVAQQRNRQVQIKAEGPVLESMIALLQDGQVVRSVVELVPVNVMNLLVGQQGSAEQFLRNQSMLRNSLAVNGEITISSQKISDTLVRATALAGAIVVRVNNIPMLPGKYNTAASAIQRDESQDATQKSKSSNRLSPDISDPRGVFHKGKVYLIASELFSDADVAETLFHEALGHAGLRGVFGKALTPILNDIVIARGPEVRAKAKQYGLDFANERQRLAAAEEVLAEMSQTRPELGFVKRAVAAIRTWLRANVPGFSKMKLSDDEIIQQYLIPARGFVERGRTAPTSDGVPIFSRSNNTIEGDAGLNIRSPQWESAVGPKGTQKKQLTIHTANGEHIGRLLIYREVDGSIDISGIGVKESERGRGVGSRLLDAAFMETGAPHMTVSTGFTGDGLEFLHKYGYSKVDGRFVFARPARLDRQTIEVDGIQRPRTNSKGQPIHPTEEGIRNFWRWFGDSKVTDADGLPLVVYHGTRRAFDVFTPSKPRGAAGNPEGIYFSPDKSTAEEYAQDVDGATDERSRVVEAYIKIESEADGQVKESRYSGSEYIVFKPENIKSTAGNSGAFDPDNADIRFSRSKSEAKTNLSEFLKGSKVRRVVYHATAADFNTFDTSRSDLGAHFGTREQAEQVAGGMRLNNTSGTNVMPVWISLKNPLRLKDVGTFHADGIADQLERKGLLPRGEGKRIIKEIDADWKLRKKYDPIVRKAIQDAGYDGVVYSNTQEGAGDSYIVFEPTQVKSAIGNSGDFDPSNPDIRFSRTTLGNAAPPPVPPAQQTRVQKLKAKALQLASPETIDNLIYQFQDKFIDLKRVQAHIKALGGVVTDLNDAYLGEELYHKRVAKRTEDFLASELKPLLAEMRTKAVKHTELEQYLHARHAPEANKTMAERNPAGEFKGTEAERLSLSGMSDAEAKAIMDGLTPEKRKAMESLAARVDAINAKTMAELEKYGLMDKASLDAWRNAYQFYVPLHRDEAHPESTSHPIGQGFSVKGDASKRRVGSNQKVTNILGHIAMQREAALTRGEKNNVAKKLYLLASQNPDANLWAVDKVPKIKTVGDNGVVRETPDPMFKMRPNVVVVRIAGKDAAIVFNERNPQALRMAEAIKNQDATDLGWLLQQAAKVTRYFSMINTQLNPIFGIVNFIRDVQGAALNLSSTPLAGKQAQVAKHLFPALRAVYRQERGKGAANEQNAEYIKLWNELQDVGGATGYRALYQTAEDRVKALEAELKKDDAGNARKVFDATLDWLSDYNEAMENSTRVAVYKVALEQGMTKERAASVAKNITVNFNRKGRMGSQIGAGYAFFNAAVQGTTRLAQTVSGPAGRKIIAGGLAVGMLNTLMGMAVMGAGEGEDDDEWSKIPDFVKERNLIIPIGRQDYVTIPMPLGFHALPNLGRLATELALMPDKTAGKQAGKALGAMLDAFNPLGGGGDPGQTIMPTVLDPAWALAANKDWTGKPIYREDMNKLDPTPGHTRAKESASAFSKKATEIINAATGGNEYRPGAWSWTPDQIDYIIGQLTGGIGREIMKAEQTITSTVTGDELPSYKVPLAGRLYGNTRGPANQSAAFYDNARELNEVENEIQGRAKAGEDIGEFMEREPLSKLVGAGNAAERQIAALRKQRRLVIQQGGDDSKAQAEEINAQIGEVMGGLNREVSRIRRETVR